MTITKKAKHRISLKLGRVADHLKKMLFGIFWNNLVYIHIKTFLKQQFKTFTLLCIYRSLLSQIWCPCYVINSKWCHYVSDESKTKCQGNKYWQRKRFINCYFNVFNFPLRFSSSARRTDIIPKRIFLIHDYPFYIPKW